MASQAGAPPAPKQPADTVRLDDKFAALAHPVRRQLVERLSRGEHTLKELAEPCNISVPAVAKHLKVLEEAGLIEKGRRSSSRPVLAVPGALDDVARWLGRNRIFWQGGFDRLDALLKREKH